MQKYLQKNQMMMLLDKRMLTLIFIVCVSFTHVVYSQPTKISITPEPVGSGARALGQSAFIAVADDATAASWNPAGLIQLEKPEASFVGAWRTITKDYSPELSGVLVNQDNWRDSEINFMSYAFPMEMGNTDVVISVNYHQVYDFGGEYNGLIPGEIIVDSRLEIEGESKGAVSAYSLAGGISMPSYPELSIGASFNWYSQSLLNDYAWRTKQTNEFFMNPGQIPFTVEDTTETFDDFRGYNFTFGLLWNVYERQENLLTLGLVYHTPFTAKVDKVTTITTDSGTISTSESMDIDFPTSLGAGLNYRFSDEFSVAFDVEWNEWSQLSNSPIDQSTLSYRLGAEHLWFSEMARESVFALRGGLFYEPRPANYRDPLPVYGLSTGLGCTVKDQYSVDFAYQYRFGEQDIGYIDYDYAEHFFVGSLIIYF